MNLFLSSVILLSKKCHFQLKQLCVLWNERKERLRDFNVPWNFEPIWACFTMFTRLLEKMKDNFPHLHWLDERIFEFLERKLRPMYALFSVWWRPLRIFAVLPFPPPSRMFSVKVRIRYINQQKSFTLYTVCYEKDIRNVVVKAR